MFKEGGVKEEGCVKELKGRSLKKDGLKRKDALKR
jgi:hypothetical protein